MLRPRSFLYKACHLIMLKIIIEPKLTRMIENEKAFELLKATLKKQMPHNELVKAVTALIKYFELQIEECFTNEAEAYAAEKALRNELLEIIKKQATELQRIINIFDLPAER